MTHRLTLLLALWPAFLTSCVAYRLDVAEPPPVVELAPGETLPEVTYELTVDSQMVFPPEVLTTRDVEARMLPLFRETFENVTASEPVAGVTHVDMYLRAKTRHPNATGLTGLISALTVGIIPFREEREYLLDLRVERDGELLSQESFHDGLAIWGSLFLVFSSFSRDPGEFTDSVVDDLMRHVIAEVASTL